MCNVGHVNILGRWLEGRRQMSLMRSHCLQCRNVARAPLPDECGKVFPLRLNCRLSHRFDDEVNEKSVTNRRHMTTNLRVDNKQQQQQQHGESVDDKGLIRVPGEVASCAMLRNVLTCER
jgi:hypothetical protein